LTGKLGLDPEGVGASTIAAEGRKDGTVSIEENARNLVLKGETSLEEAVRQTWRGDCDDAGTQEAQTATLKD